MKAMPPFPYPQDKPWPRDHFLPLLQTGLEVGQHRFVRQAALAWLSAYEGDLEVQLLRAQALLGEGLQEQALKVLDQLCRADPEFTHAQQLRAQTAGQVDDPAVEAARGCVHALEAEAGQGAAPAWAQALLTARGALSRGDFERAERQIAEALAAQPLPPLAAVTHLKILWSQSSTPTGAIRSLADHYHQRWPECLACTLILADSLMKAGGSDNAVALLHQAAGGDVGGQVAARLWGQDHPYRALWPNNLEALLDLSIPADVAAAQGWNLLPQGKGKYYPRAPQEVEPSSKSEAQAEPAQAQPEKAPPPSKPAPAQEPAPQPEAPPLPKTPETIQHGSEKEPQDFDMPDVNHSDGRLPVYVVFTTRSGLESQYGPDTTAVLDRAMEKLVLTIREKAGWGSLLVYADDPGNMAAMGLKPAAADDAWGLKLALADLDAALNKRGAMIGAVLIVGGPKVVPYHHLPNPTDDSDVDVPSDNPYATRDENYFVPEWPVGRLPGGSDRDPVVLVSVLRAISEQHAQDEIQGAGWWQRWWQWLIELVRGSFPYNSSSPNFGYTAEIWQRASHAVFRPIGKPQAMITSPPVGSHNQIPQPKAKLGYFNLHGLVDAVEWYGQRDPTSAQAAPDFPIAFRPQDVVNSGQAPQVIFSEACYGAHIIDRSIEESLALKFLLAGSQAIIGSTVISYGSITTPLNAADLLGKAFWKYLQEGFPAGEALRRAKIYLASEMHRRQGYLDGEDQKTLISFVLYGDPLAVPREGNERGGFSGHRRSPKEVLRYLDAPPRVRTVCDKANPPGCSEPVPNEVMAHVKRVVEQYLPGMEGAQLSMSYEQADCGCQGHNCPTGQLEGKSRPAVNPERRVVTLSKELRDARHVHPSFARLTFDKTGKMVKLAVSR
jgi:hypothetical protein